jgi:hypothetical protein
MAARPAYEFGMGRRLGGRLTRKGLHPGEPLGTLVPGISFDYWGFNSIGNGKFVSRQALFDRNHAVLELLSILRQLDSIPGPAAHERLPQRG